MDGDPEALSLAVELASRHNIDRFNILINHVETTINNYNFDQAKFADIKIEMCLKMSVLDEIKTDERFIGRLNKYCWPQMIGRDHRRLKLYWLTLKLSENEEIVSKCQNDLDFLSSLVDLNCLNFDYKCLTEAEKPSEMVDILDKDLNTTNLIKVDQSLVQYKTHYEAFTVAAEWLIRNMNETLIDTLLKLPESKQTEIVDHCTGGVRK